MPWATCTLKSIGIGDDIRLSFTGSTPSYNPASFTLEENSDNGYLKVTTTGSISEFAENQSAEFTFSYVDNGGSTKPGIRTKIDSVHAGNNEFTFKPV